MIKHAIDVVRKAVNFLNAGQANVICMDQPLYALAKKIQWNWPESYGEDKLVVIFGPLHIEMGALRVLGEWLDQSGWTSALVQVNITPSGIADSCLTASHVGRSRRAHQVTACGLYILLTTSYKQYQDSLAIDAITLGVDEWCKQRCEESPHFNF